MMPTVVLSRRGAARLRSGHPWIYRSDIIEADAAPGDLVDVRSDRARPLGWGLWSDASLIALRMLRGEVDPADDRRWIRSRLDQALAWRLTLRIDATAWRLVSGEGDDLPGLVIDRYGDGDDTWLVLQALSQAMDRRMPVIAELLGELLHPRGVLARNDPRVRRLEGLESDVAVLSGEVPDQVEVREGINRFRVDLRHGQKTGAFLDQRENHQRAATLARGRALDAFTYHGGFALAMAPNADSVVALDSSAAAVAATRDHALLNGCANVSVREANVFDALREFEASRERFDMVVLDPPAFAKSRAAVPKALSGYKEINLRAMKLLAPGGRLMTCSCSYHVDEPMLRQVVREAAADAGVTLRVLETRQQAADHPVLATVPETHYLKCLVLERTDDKGDS